MDCLGEGVSQQVKSAIKAKLRELGIEVDADFVDYIMVMVCNRRGRKAMEGELKLFLRGKSVSFTSWLFKVLDHLQEVTISTQDSQTKPKKSEKVPSEKSKDNLGEKVSDKASCKKRERTPSVEEQDYLNIRADTEADPIDDLQTTGSVLDEDAALKNTASSSHLTTVNKEPTEQNPIKLASVKVKDSPPKLPTNSEKRKFTEDSVKVDGGTKRRRVSPPVREKESERDTSRPPVKEKERERDSSRSKEKSGSESGKREKAVYDVRELLNRRKAEKSAPEGRRSREAEREKRRKSPPSKKPPSGRERESEKERCKERERVRERERLKRSSSRELSSDKRRPPSKVVRVESSLRGADYDAADARIGRLNVSERSRGKASSSGGESGRESEREREKEATVPSVVRVTPRPVRPTNQQPSSSLILKAMAEANKSLVQQATIASRTSNAIMNRNPDSGLRRMISPEKITITLTNNRIQPITKEDKENKLYVPSNGRDESYERLRQSRALMRRAAALEDNKLKEMEMQSTAAEEEVKTTTIAANESKQSIGIRRRGEIVMKEEVKDGLEEAVVETEGQYLKYLTDGGDVGQEEEEKAIEPRHVQRRGGGRRSSESATNSSPTSRSFSFVSDTDKANDALKKWLEPGNLQSNSPDKLSHETDPESEPVLEICPNVSEFDVEEPEFVVTLNGFNDSMYSCLSDDDEHLTNNFDHDMNDCDLPHTNDLNHSANIVIQPQDPKQDTPSTEPIDSKQASAIKSLERCRFWPNCLLGDKCAFIHPTTMCKMFPACKYGDHCLFIHPPCKFGVACTRRDCTYKHPPVVAKAKVSVMSASAAAQNCRFYPNCSNPACPFFHPKPCKFGSYCTKKNCTFDHSVRHNKGKLKWIRTE